MEQAAPRGRRGPQEAKAARGRRGGAAAQAAPVPSVTDLPFAPPAERAWPAAKVRMMALKALVPAARNARTHSQEQVDLIAQSIRRFGWTVPCLVDEDGELIAGHGRVLAAKQIGISKVPVMEAIGWTDAEKAAYRLADNQLPAAAGWDTGLLRIELDALLPDFSPASLGFSESVLAGLFPPEVAPAAPTVRLADKFGIPPFSVLNAREGWWQNRKRAWLALGIQSELGRGEQLIPLSETAKAKWAGTLERKGDAAETEDLRGGLTHRTTADPYRAKKRANATPGGAAMPAANYKNKARGDGRGREIK